MLLALIGHIDLKVNVFEFHVTSVDDAVDGDVSFIIKIINNIAIIVSISFVSTILQKEDT